jgi:hypothetical protein
MTHPQVCIHAHFYQPPRENPATGEVAEEPGAAPYRNWNEKILATCYRPNVELRNFSRISFNIGPTLAQWLEKNSPDVLQGIVSEDALNVRVYGVGNALAQPFNHSILPLLTAKDKMTQITWGIRAFQHVFGRSPHGMWLPETAVDNETLLMLVQNGIQFTILAPWQVDKVSGNSPYRIELGRGKSIIAFVYHGGLSSRMSFDTFATSNADAFAEFYLKPEMEANIDDQLLMIATDGELYGHHQSFRDKFLAHLLDGSIDAQTIKSTFPALWLKQNKVTGVARIREDTSWSCHHGVDRWKKECDCTPGSAWKEPLRRALDIMAEEIEVIYRDIALQFGFDPIEAERSYIEVILGQNKLDKWLNTLLKREPNNAELGVLRAIFDVVYNRQRMFTSCGWFFGNLARLEPRYNIAVAAHAAWVVERVFGKDLHTPILALLDNARDEAHGLTAGDIFRLEFARLKTNPVIKT